MIDLAGKETINEQDFRRVLETLVDNIEKDGILAINGLPKKNKKHVLETKYRILITALIIVAVIHKADKFTSDQKNTSLVLKIKHISPENIGLIWNAMTLFLSSLSNKQWTEVQNDVRNLGTSLFPNTPFDDPYFWDMKKSKYFIIAQSAATNALAKQITVKIMDATQLDMWGNAEIIGSSLKLFILGYRNLIEKGGINQSAARLLDCLVIIATTQGLQNTIIRLPLKEYMFMRGISDIKEARAQVNRDLDALWRVSFEYKGIGKHRNEWFKARLCDAVGVIKNGEIIFSFALTFFNSLKINDNGSSAFMHFPREALTKSIKYNPYSYCLARKIAEHKRMNQGRSNENIIAVKTLIDACPNFPTYQEVAAGNRGIAQRIIAPFERDMDALTETLSWHYAGVEESPADYASFIAATVVINWKNYPDTGKLAAQKTKRERKKTIGPAKKQTDK